MLIIVGLRVGVGNGVIPAVGTIAPKLRRIKITFNMAYSAYIMARGQSSCISRSILAYQPRLSAILLLQFSKVMKISGLLDRENGNYNIKTNKEKMETDPNFERS